MTSQRLNASALAGAIAVLRGWRNDGADGESAHAVCDALEAARTTLEEIRRAARYDRPTSELLDEIEKMAKEALK